LDTVGLRAACCFTKDFRGSGGAQLLHLRKRLWPSVDTRASPRIME
jgi:hypothetical protein